LAKRDLPEQILAYVAQRQTEGHPAVAAGDLAKHLGQPRSTLSLHLTHMVKAGRLLREGRGPATQYRIAPGGIALAAVAPPAATLVPAGPKWGGAARAVRGLLEAPIGRRQPVSYQREFLDRYAPNESALLPQALSHELLERGRMPGQQPAGTYARKILEQLLIDLSWYSSRLEGNRRSLLDTRELFARGRSAGDDLDATMLLNHKDAIEFIVDAVPTQGITVPVVRNIQSVLMNGLLANPTSLGAIRRSLVHITDSVYLPSQVPMLLEEMLAIIVEKAQAIRDPIECAFFLWVNIAYLQPFEDGNKRTSRLCANLPLLLANCAPLSFLDVEQPDYVVAMLGVYERCDVSIAVDLFDWTYRRSIDKYRAVRDSLGSPNPFRARYREQLGNAIVQIVAHGASLSQAVAHLHLPGEDLEAFQRLLREELAALEPYNCARYRLPLNRTNDWIARGRPA
jgi:hypothetical protein